jgi:serine/threonine protein kinase
VKLLDLGLAKSFGENTLLSLSGQVFGTPQYMSPEQARAERGMDFRTDIYALGLTLYFAVTGEIPFHGGNATQVMARKLTEQLPDPREFAPETSAHFCRMLEKMTAQEVEHRYTSWDDVLRDLHLVRAGTAPQIPLAFAGTSAMKRLGGLKPVEGRAPSRPSPHDGGTGVPPVDSNFEQEGNEEHQDPLRPSRPSVKHSAPQVSGLSPQPSKKTRTTLIASAFLTLLVLVLAATDSKLCLPQK